MAEASPFVRFREEPLDELDAALMVARLLDENLDEATVRADVAALAEGFSSASARSARTLCDYMIEQGFSGSTDGYFGLANSRIDQVLERRSGIPITLAVLYLEVARRAGLEAVGINFPAHFLVEVDGQLVDPFNRQVTDQASCERWLSEAGYSGSTEHAFRRTSSADVAMRMLNNVRGVLASEQRWAEALDVLDHQEVLVPEEPQLALERAQLWLGAGAVDMARSVLTDALDRFSDPDARRRIRRVLDTLPDDNRGPVLN